MECFFVDAGSTNHGGLRPCAILLSQCGPFPPFSLCPVRVGPIGPCKLASRCAPTNDLFSLSSYPQQIVIHERLTPWVAPRLHCGFLDNLLHRLVVAVVTHRAQTAFFPLGFGHLFEPVLLVWHIAVWRLLAPTPLRKQYPFHRNDIQVLRNFPLPIPRGVSDVGSRRVREEPNFRPPSS